MVLVHAFHLYGGIEGFSPSVIVTVAFSTHAADHMVVGQNALVFKTSVLAPAVRVMDHPL